MGIQTVKPFTMSGAWEAKWSASDNNCAFYLYDEAGDIDGVFGLSTSESYYSPKGGTFHFMANTIGSWTVNISPVP